MGLCCPPVWAAEKGYSTARYLACSNAIGVDSSLDFLAVGWTGGQAALFSVPPDICWCQSFHKCHTLHQVNWSIFQLVLWEERIWPIGCLTSKISIAKSWLSLVLQLTERPAFFGYLTSDTRLEKHSFDLVAKQTFDGNLLKGLISHIREREIVSTHYDKEIPWNLR